MFKDSQESSNTIQKTWGQIRKWQIELLLFLNGSEAYLYKIFSNLKGKFYKLIFLSHFQHVYDIISFVTAICACCNSLCFSSSMHFITELIPANCVCHGGLIDDRYWMAKLFIYENKKKLTESIWFLFWCSCNLFQIHIKVVRGTTKTTLSFYAWKVDERRLPSCQPVTSKRIYFKMQRSSY